MVEINNLTTVEVNEVLIKKTVEAVLNGEGADVNSNVSIAFVGPGRMRKLNKTYRKKNRVTDVLSFEGSRVGFQKFKIGPTQKMEGIGEIVVCLREVTKNTERENSNFETELKRVIVHGVLHLLGYDHECSEAEAEKMREKEEQYIKGLH